MDGLIDIMGDTAVSAVTIPEYKVVGYTRSGRAIKKPIKFCPVIKPGELKDDFSNSDYDSDESMSSEISDEEDKNDWDESDEDFVCSDGEIEYDTESSSDDEEEEEFEEDKEFEDSKME